MRLDADDHDFCRFDKRASGLAFAELHLAGGIGGDDGSDLLVSNFEDDLGQEAADLYLRDGADELIAAAYIAEALA